jgi:U4/U6.U5 tri-snRNP-associated protein 3
MVSEASEQVTGPHRGVAGQSYGEMDVDLPEGNHAAGVDRKSKSSKNKPKELDVDDDDDIVIEEDESIADMQAMLDIRGFGTTKQKKIAGNDAYAVRKEKKTVYRQYMNRQGGFNRPLSPSRD